MRPYSTIVEMPDLGESDEQLDQAGHAYELVGYPDHAPGGEVRTRDPDGNVVLSASTPSRSATERNLRAHRRGFS